MRKGTQHTQESKAKITSSLLEFRRNETEGHKQETIKKIREWYARAHNAMKEY